jgi:RNA polymerase sigma-70 factor (ECF subfamily)
MMTHALGATDGLPLDDSDRDETALSIDVSTLDDRDLAALASEGRESAYRELLTRYERPVFSLVYRMVRQRSQAEDLAQEAFIRAFGAIDSYNPGYKFSSWLFKIANNHTIDWLRKKKLDTVSIDGSPHATGAAEVARTSWDLEASGERPDDYVQNRELGGQIEQAIAELRPEYRTVVMLRHIEGYSYDEIAETMELPLGTVKTYLHRARAALKDILAPRLSS